MTTFDEREKAYEAKFAHDADLKFKAAARANKMLAEWAGRKLGLADAALAGYCGAVLHAELTGSSTAAVFAKVKGDFAAKGVAIADVELYQKMAEFLAESTIGLSTKKT